MALRTMQGRRMWRRGDVWEVVGERLDVRFGKRKSPTRK